jgi:hypothetical protein
LNYLNFVFNAKKRKVNFKVILHIFCSQRHFIQQMIDAVFLPWLNEMPL